MPLLSIITPAFNEAENLPHLYAGLVETLGATGVDWEWIVVDDHSRDRTFEVVSDLAARDPRVTGVRFARHAGSHTAIACGLHEATGRAAALLAGDLQDPPEVLTRLLAEWREGAQVVWGVRGRREGTAASAVGFARAYYFIMRRLVGLRDMPPSGADVFLIDRAVIDAFRQFGESHTSVLALITWMGFRQASVTYDKQPRARGASGWTLRKKITLVVDSITAFSSFPIRLVSYSGLVVALAGLGSAVALAARAAAGRPIRGWPVVLAAIALATGVQMLILGMLGEYLWRALDETRRRPRFLVEARTGDFHVLQ